MQTIRLPKKKSSLGLYIHLPFCQKKCDYCDFYSLENQEKQMKRYLNALAAQMKLYTGAASGYIVDTIYFGGGTPSLLPPALWKKLFKWIHEYFIVSDTAEITVEVNPKTGGKALWKTLKKLKVNRISIGLQSTHDNELSALGRIHTYADFLTCLEEIRAVGFENIGADLMYGIPLQTPESFKESLAAVCSLPLTHLSVYGLTIEEHTPFGKRHDLPLPDEETERNMYFTAIENLEEHGFKQDEISNFSRPGFHSRHNLKYWNCDEYLGLGVSASSYFASYRFTCVRDLESFMSVMEGKSEKNLFPDRMEIPFRENVGEYVMLRLRLTDGIRFADFQRRFGKDFEQIFGENLRKYRDTPYLVCDARGVHLTPEGFYVSNAILADLLNV